jgi:N6-adenosine-specific RNA methylase IME4
MKFRVIIADPPYNFSDSLTMGKTKRGASSVYDTLSIQDLKDLQVKDLAEDDSVLVLWCPSSLLQDGLDIMKSWGFRQTQTHIWVKTKKFHLKDLLKSILKWSKSDNKLISIEDIVKKFILDDVLAFGMGRLFRQTHEIALVGVRGKIYKHLQNKSQRSVHFFPATKHSEKPDALQNMLDKMFSGNKLEIFARRDLSGWVCIGNQFPSTIGEDVRASIDRLKNT